MRMWAVCLCVVVTCTTKVLGDRQRRDDDEIVVSTIEVAPYATLKQPTGTGNDNFEGFIPDLMKEIGKKLNMKYRFKIVSDGKYGMQHGSRWDGMVGEVIRGDADMAAAPVTVTDVRKRVVDFTDPFMSFGTTILITKPAPGKSPLVSSAKQLSEQTEVKYGIVRDGTTEAFFKSSKDQTYSKMWAFMSNNQQFMVRKIEDGVKRVRDSNGKYAFIMDSSMADFWVGRKPCDLMTIGGRMNENHYGMVIQKGDDLRTRLNTALRNLRSEGVLGSLQKKWWKADPACGSAGGAVPTNHVIALLLSTVLAYLFLL